MASLLILRTQLSRSIAQNKFLELDKKRLEDDRIKLLDSKEAFFPRSAGSSGDACTGNQSGQQSVARASYKDKHTQTESGERSFLQATSETSVLPAQPATSSASCRPTVSAATLSSDSESSHVEHVEELEARAATSLQVEFEIPTQTVNTGKDKEPDSTSDHTTPYQTPSQPLSPAPPAGGTQRRIKQTARKSTGGMPPRIRTQELNTIPVRKDDKSIALQDQELFSEDRDNAPFSCINDMNDMNQQIEKLLACSSQAQTALKDRARRDPKKAALKSPGGKRARKPSDKLYSDDSRPTSSLIGDGMDIFMSKLVNPAASTKLRPILQTLILKKEAIYERLQHLGHPVFPVFVSSELKKHTTTRKILQDTFQGNEAMQITQTNSASWREYGTHFICLSLVFHPHAPQVPGAHGIITPSGSRDDGLHLFENEEGGYGRTLKLIVGIGINRWLYTGEYKLEEAEPLSRAQWRAFPDTKVKVFVLRCVGYDKAFQQKLASSRERWERIVREEEGSESAIETPATRSVLKRRPSDISQNEDSPKPKKNKGHELQHTTDVMEVLTHQLSEPQKERHELQISGASERVLKEEVAEYHHYLKDRRSSSSIVNEHAPQQLLSPIASREGFTKKKQEPSTSDLVLDGSGEDRPADVKLEEGDDHELRRVDHYSTLDDKINFSVKEEDIKMEQIENENAVLSTEECKVALKHIKNPEIGDLSSELPADVIFSRIRDIGVDIFPIGTDVFLLNYLFKREDLSAACGGSPQGTFPKISNVKYTSLHPYKRFMCPSLEYNPHAPQIPGAPGLYFALRDTRLWPNREELVISRYDANKWNVMGLYDIKMSKALTGEEFQRMPRNVQNTWIDNVRKNGWGLLTLAAIYLRRQQGCEPIAVDIENNLKRGKGFFHKHVSRSEIETAFMKGEEVCISSEIIKTQPTLKDIIPASQRINVWTMKCTGYDEEFKRRVVPDHLLGGNEMTSTDNSNAGVKLDELEEGPKLRNQAGTSNANVPMNTRKRPRSSSDRGHKCKYEFQEEDGESSCSEGYIPTGTKTRPRRNKVIKTA
ncbi:hypothetical protein EW145_g4760 [Phellinidium pouzarii]|uniref:DUF6697 domain-containing protein n=1 Tax=Phellinidium pouzarii TaxID=167371 RepID=A0A4S4L476_9AGAM|nr:hypothetical protein EW145_g4760 [Phellinidium pouzarii]